MAKDNKHNDREKDELTKLRRELREKEKHIIARCNHTKAGGKKLALELLDNGKYKCKKCGEVFNMDKIARKDITNALTVIHDMLNQTRCMTNPDRLADMNIGQHLGVLNFDVKEAAELYERIVRENGNNNRDRDRDRDRRRRDDDREDYGSYGSLSLGKGNKGGKNRDRDRDRDRDRGGRNNSSRYY